MEEEYKKDYDICYSVAVFKEAAINLLEKLNKELQSYADEEADDSKRDCEKRRLKTKIEMYEEELERLQLMNEYLYLTRSLLDKFWLDLVKEIKND